MTVTHIWRYPVKTMAGEEMQRSVIGPLGIEGDRLVHVEDARGRVVTSRSHPRFLGMKGAADAQGIITVDGRRTQDVTQDRKRDVARNAIRQRKSDEEFAEFVRQTRDRAYVEFKTEEK